jgi:thermitase
MDPARRDALISLLKARPDVIIAEENQQVSLATVPNEPGFFYQWNMQNRGQYSGNVGADVDAVGAWTLHTGSPSEQIGIIDGGVSPHIEFGSRVYGDIGTSAHATMVAGIAGATGNNGVGPAGMCWSCGIRSDTFGDVSASEVADAIVSSVNAGAKVLNNSYVTGNSSIVQIAIGYAYNNDALFVVSMPEDGNPDEYPAKFFEWRTNLTVNVGATTNTNVRLPLVSSRVDLSGLLATL